MAVAIISPEGAILGIHPKPRPTMVIPSGGRMIPYNEPPADRELSTVQVVEPVPAEASEVTFIVTDKQPSIVNAVVKERLRAQIKTMEREAMMPRSMREFMLASLEAKAVKDDKITTAQLRASNVAYRKDKEIDEQIAVLRAQIAAL